MKRLIVAAVFLVLGALPVHAANLTTLAKLNLQAGDLKGYAPFNTMQRAAPYPQVAVSFLQYGKVAPKLATGQTYGQGPGTQDFESVVTQFATARLAAMRTTINSPTPTNNPAHLGQRSAAYVGTWPSAIGPLPCLQITFVERSYAVSIFGCDDLAGGTDVNIQALTPVVTRLARLIDSRILHAK